jgi:hypothetical protein
VKPFKVLRMRNPSSGGGSGPTSTQWRFYFPDGDQGYGNLQIVEAEMRAVSGGPDQCNGGTASASSYYNSTFVPSNAFDDLGGSYYGYGPGGAQWAAANSAVGGWLQYTFLSAVAVNEFTIFITAATSSAPNRIILQYYNGASWVGVYDTGTLSWSSSELKVFTL